MRVVVDFQDDQFEFEVADDRVVASFRGPSGIPETERIVAITHALEGPRDFPPISRMLVPGDRIAIALDSRLPDARDVLMALLPMVRDGVGESGEITVVATPDVAIDLASMIPSGIQLVIHDPADRTELAYLASTQQGRRIYFNRHLTDADVVIPVGEFRFDPVLGCQGPWTVLFPGLSDTETRKDYLSPTPESAPSSIHSSNIRNDESIEAGWLLGSQFSIGLIPGRSGFSEVVAGLSTSVREQGTKLLESSWNFVADSRAEMVVAGVGRAGVDTPLDVLVAGIEAATQAVQHGGKIVVLSRAKGKIGRALRRLIEAGEPRRGAAALRSHEADEDYSVALRLNRALEWADVYLLSALDPQTVEDLSMVPLAKATEAMRLAANSRSCIFLSQADLTRVGVADDT